MEGERFRLEVSGGGMHLELVGCYPPFILPCIFMHWRRDIGYPRRLLAL